MFSFLLCGGAAVRPGLVVSPLAFELPSSSVSPVRGGVPESSPATLVDESGELQELVSFAGAVRREMGKEVGAPLSRVYPAIQFFAEHVPLPVVTVDDDFYVERRFRIAALRDRGEISRDDAYELFARLDKYSELEAYERDVLGFSGEINVDAALLKRPAVDIDPLHNQLERLLTVPSTAVVFERVGTAQFFEAEFDALLARIQ